MTRIDHLPKLSEYVGSGISLETVLNWTKDREWKDAGVHSHTDKQVTGVVKNSRDASFISLKDFSEEVLSLVLPLVGDYAQRNSLKDLELESFAFVRYVPGQFFEEHSDGGDTNPRRLSMVIYLNDDYVGGEIYFTRFKSLFKPSARSIFLFPPTEEYSHAAQPVISGTKYVLIGFWK
jgi:hypothetical protein